MHGVEERAMSQFGPTSYWLHALEQGQPFLEVVGKSMISLEREECSGEGAEVQGVLDVKIPLLTLDSFFKAHFDACMSLTPFYRAGTPHFVTCMYCFK